MAQHAGGNERGSVVVGLGHVDEHGARLDPLDQQRPQLRVRLDQPGCTAAGPEAQRGDLVGRLTRVAAHLENAWHGRTSGVEARRRCDVVVGNLREMRFQLQRPAPG